MSDWDFLTPGSIYEINLKLDSTAYLFNEGHKLRIDISSSNYPRYETNPNTGDPLWANSTTYVANNTIYTNSSKVTLPLTNYNSLIPFSFDFTTPLSLYFEEITIDNEKSVIAFSWFNQSPIEVLILLRKTSQVCRFLSLKFLLL